MKVLKSLNTGILIPDPENEGEIIKGANYLQLCDMCVKSSDVNPQTGYPTGFTVADIRSRMKILDAIKASEKGGSLMLEDEDAKKLQKCVESFIWGKVNQEVLDFTDAVEGMKVYKNGK